MAKLYVKFNSAVIKEVDLSKDEITFGRKPGNDIVLDHPTVSGFHGKIRKDGDRYVVEDLKSTNGTYINGRRVESGILANKDQIGVASHILEFISEVVEIVPVPSPSTATSRSSAPEEEKVGSVVMKEGTFKEADDEALPSASSDSKGAGSEQGSGTIRIVSGGVEGQTEVKLKDLVTYIGTSEQAAVKAKGFLVPSLAAAITRRPEGYFLKAVKSGYPKVNGNAVKEQVFLENGALIEVGGTNMVFYVSDGKKAG